MENSEKNKEKQVNKSQPAPVEKKTEADLKNPISALPTTDAKLSKKLKFGNMDNKASYNMQNKFKNKTSNLSFRKKSSKGR